MYERGIFRERSKDILFKAIVTPYSADSKKAFNAQRSAFDEPLLFEHLLVFPSRLKKESPDPDKQLSALCHLHSFVQFRAL